MRNGFSRGNTPGPGAYELNKENSKGVTISGYKGKNSIEITPGPGAYELASDQTKRPCSAKYFLYYQRIGKGGRSNLGINDTPGPGQYYPHDSSNYKFAFGKQARSKDLKGGDPGPGRTYFFIKSILSPPLYQVLLITSSIQVSSNPTLDFIIIFT